MRNFSIYIHNISYTLLVLLLISWGKIKILLALKVTINVWLFQFNNFFSLFLLSFSMPIRLWGTLSNVKDFYLVSGDLSFNEQRMSCDWCENVRKYWVWSSYLGNFYRNICYLAIFKCLGIFEIINWIEMDFIDLIEIFVLCQIGVLIKTFLSGCVRDNAGGILRFDLRL